jgi:hypothetical protein
MHVYIVFFVVCKRKKEKLLAPRITCAVAATFFALYAPWANRPATPEHVRDPRCRWERDFFKHTHSTMDPTAVAHNNNHNNINFFLLLLLPLLHVPWPPLNIQNVSVYFTYMYKFIFTLIDARPESPKGCGMLESSQTRRLHRNNSEICFLFVDASPSANPHRNGVPILFTPW